MVLRRDRDPWFAAIGRVPHKLDRGLLHVAEFFFGPRDSWEWWRRKQGLS